jgi:hypothetical protein
VSGRQTDTPTITVVDSVERHRTPWEMSSDFYRWTRTRVCVRFRVDASCVAFVDRCALLAVRTAGRVRCRKVATRFVGGESRTRAGRHVPDRFDGWKRAVTSDASCVRSTRSACGVRRAVFGRAGRTGRMCLHRRHRSRGWTNRIDDARCFGGVRQDAGSTAAAVVRRRIWHWTRGSRASPKCGCLGCAQGRRIRGNDGVTSVTDVDIRMP